MLPTDRKPTCDPGIHPHLPERRSDPLAAGWGRRCSRYSGLLAIALCIVASSAFAQSVADIALTPPSGDIKLNAPVAITANSDKQQTFIATGNGNLLRLGGEKPEVLTDWKVAPAALDQIKGMTFRDGYHVTLLGTRNESAALATWNVSPDKPIKFMEGLSGELGFEKPDSANCITSTDLAIYVGTNAGSNRTGADADTENSQSGSIWHIDAGRASLGKANRVSPTRITPSRQSRSRLRDISSPRGREKRVHC